MRNRILDSLILEVAFVFSLSNYISLRIGKLNLENESKKEVLVKVIFKD